MNANTSPNDLPSTAVPPSEDEASDPVTSSTRPRRKRRWVASTVSVAILGSLFLAGYLPKQHAQAALVAEAASLADEVLRVEIIRPKRGASERAMTLPGSVRALEETVVYARANGYVRRWLADMGDEVKEGQLLAELDTPELDREIEQAKAGLGQSEAAVLQTRASAEYSRSNLKRYEVLAPQGIASQQELDQKRSQAVVDEANAQVSLAAKSSQEANVRRLLQLKSFARVVAPFAGTITSRGVDRGTLVLAGTSEPLFHIVVLDPVRVLVQIPQSLAPSVRPSLKAKVSVDEYPDRVFEGDVTRTAATLDSGSRTMNTEIRVANPDHRLLPGMYADVTVTLSSPHRIFVLPAPAVISGKEGVRVAVLGADNRVHIVPVVIERDSGSEVEIASGLSGDESIIATPGPSVKEGMSVQPR